MDGHLRARALHEITRAPAWVSLGPASAPRMMFVHGGFHTAMLESEPPLVPDGRVHGVLARALYGEPTGRIQPDGYPERSLRWVDRIPEGLTVTAAMTAAAPTGDPMCGITRMAARPFSSTLEPARAGISPG